MFSCSTNSLKNPNTSFIGQSQRSRSSNIKMKLPKFNQSVEISYKDSPDKNFFMITFPIFWDVSTKLPVIFSAVSPHFTFFWIFWRASSANDHATFSCTSVMFLHPYKEMYFTLRFVSSCFSCSLIASVSVLLAKKVFPLPHSPSIKTA